MSVSPLAQLHAALEDPSDAALQRACAIVMSNEPYAMQLGRLYRRKLAQVAQPADAMRIFDSLHMVLKHAAAKAKTTGDRVHPIIKQWVKDRTLVCIVTAFACAVSSDMDVSARGRRRLATWADDERGILPTALGKALVELYDAFLVSRPPSDYLKSAVLGVPRKPLTDRQVPVLPCLLLEEDTGQAAADPSRPPAPGQTPSGAGSNGGGGNATELWPDIPDTPVVPPALRVPDAAQVNDTTRRAVEARRRLERQRVAEARPHVPAQLFVSPSSPGFGPTWLHRWSAEEVVAASACHGAPELERRMRQDASAFIHSVVRTLRLEEAVAGMAHVAFHQYWALRSPSPDRDPLLVTLACVLAAIKLTCSYCVVDSVCKGGHAILRRCAALNVSVSEECGQLQAYIKNSSGAARSSRIPPPPTSMAQDTLMARTPACPLFHARQTLANTLGVMKLPAGTRGRLGSRTPSGPGSPPPVGRTASGGSEGAGGDAGGGGDVSVVQQLLRGSGASAGKSAPSPAAKRRVPEGVRVPCGPGPLLEAPQFEGDVVKRYRDHVVPLEWEAVTGNMPLIDAIPPNEACRMFALYTPGCPVLVHDLAWRRLRKIMPTRVWAILTPSEVAAASLVSAALSRGQILAAERLDKPEPLAAKGAAEERPSTRRHRDAVVAAGEGPRARVTGLAASLLEPVRSGHEAWLRERVPNPEQVFGFARAILAHFKDAASSSKPAADLGEDAVLLQPMSEEAAGQWLEQHGAKDNEDVAGEGDEEPSPKRRR